MTVSQDFIDAEQTAERRPAELYHLWQTGVMNKYFTSGDTPVVYDGNTYVPTTVERGSFKHTVTVEETKVSLNFADVPDPFDDYIDQTIVDTIWIKIMKIHRGMSPVEVNTTFVGRIKSITFEGKYIKTSCSGIKGLYKKVIPKYRYQPTCNHLLYSTECGLVKTNFDYQGVVSALTTDGLYFESNDIFALMVGDGIDTENWCQWGYAEFGNYRRVIAIHSDKSFYLRYKIPGLAVSDTITVYAGCDGLPITCRDKFSNMNNFLGFKDIPFDNPVTTAVA